MEFNVGYYVSYGSREYLLAPDMAIGPYRDKESALQAASLIKGMWECELLEQTGPYSLKWTRIDSGYNARK